MSYVLKLDIGSPPSRAALTEGLGLPDLKVTAADGGDWEKVVHLSRAGRSTRSTEISYEDGRFEVRVLSLASPEDGDLALRVVEVAAALTGTTVVDAELTGEIPVATLRASHDAAWIESLAVSGARVLSALLRDGRGPMQIPGPVRSYYLGTRTLDALERDASGEPLHRRLVEAIRRVQWIDEGRFEATGVFQATRATGGAPFTFAVWRGSPIFFPAVDRALIDTATGPAGARGEVFLVPAASVPDLAGARFTPMDERQGTIDAFPAEEWARLVDAARRLRVD